MAQSTTTTSDLPQATTEQPRPLADDRMPDGTADPSVRGGGQPRRSGSWSRRLWPWIVAGFVLLCAVVLSIAIAEASRAWAVVVFLAGAVSALAVLRLTCVKHRTDKYLEYAMVVLASTLMINIITNLVWEGWIKGQPPATAALYANHDLARLTGTVIKAVLEKTVADARSNQLVIASPDQDALLKIAGVMSDPVGAHGQPPLQWERWMSGAFARDATAWRGIEQDALVQYIRNPQTQALSADAWKRFLAQAAGERRVEVSDQSLSVAGTRCAITSAA